MGLHHGLFRRHRGRWPLLILLGASPLAADEPSLTELEQLPLEQLVQIIGLELETEDKRDPERLLGFEEFQDVNELDCTARLLYLLKQTIAARDKLWKYNQDLFGFAGMYLRLLQAAPQENSWIWMLTTAHERILQVVQTYWSRVVALALDEHHCLLTRVRDVILDGVMRWKKLHTGFTAMQWGSFAYGSYSNVTVMQYLDDKVAAPQGWEPGLLHGTPSGSLAAGNLFVVSLREWFEQYTQDLGNVLMTLETTTIGQDAMGATRLHHQDEHGSFVTYEFLRRKAFGQWAIDKGLLRGLIRHVWQPPLGAGPAVSVADFGAGGGHYSTWLNETGLVEAFAFDGTHQAAELTDGVVQEVNLVEDMVLWRNFTWVMCLEVGEHIPSQFSSGLLRNLKRHASEGLVISWSDDWEGLGHVNCLSRAEFVAKVENETGFVLDEGATEAVRASCEIDYIARTIAVFRARP